MENQPARDEPPTRSSLMDQIRDPANAAAWQRYWETYLPRIRGWCAAAGLHGADLDEVVAMVLAKVVQTMNSGWVYDPRQTYRGWLWRVCYSQIGQFRKDEARQPARGSGDSQVTMGLQQVPAPPEVEAVEEELARKVQRALERVRERLGADSVKWQCFQGTALEGRRGEEVARRLGIKVGLVHQNKSRVAREIRAEVGKLRDEGS
jgi:RNA polymerase sigma factor (sigma-70 family)